MSAEKRRSTGGKRMSQSNIPVEAKMETMKLTEDPAPSKKMESAAPTEKPKKQDKERKDQKSAQKSNQQQSAKKKMEEPALIGITCPKTEDLSEWYQQVILKGEMLEFTDIPGCYIYQPASYRIWEFIQAFFNERIRKMKVKNCYFPLFITEANLQREKDHIEGFAAEVAWVTEGGKNKLEKRLAVRPTSETAMYSFYAKKIRSHRDLPLKMNQWNNVVRWEFKHPMPFLRSREFLWQEGHTAHLTEEEAGKEVLEILDHYAAIYEDLLAVPVVKGKKTVNEQFPGAHYTTTLEGFIPSVGRGIQAATSHCLGQHFAKMFDITVEDPNQQIKEGEKRDKLYVWQNSWGFTTRSIGVMVLIHGDDKGLVIPPRVAEVQVIIVPVGVTAKMAEADKQKLYDEVDSLRQKLEDVDVRVECDYREGYNVGYKFNDWEMKGVPLRLEFGPKDAAKGVVTTSRRDQSGSKGEIAVGEIATKVPELLEQIQKDMFQKAADEYSAHRKIVKEWKDFVPTLNDKNVIVVPHCTTGDCEDEIKKDSSGNIEGQEVDVRAPSMGAKSLCIPAQQPEESLEEKKCINPKCGKDAVKWVMFGRSY
jgi:prolyl-tRNA synthetase